MKIMPLPDDPEAVTGTESHWLCSVGASTGLEYNRESVEQIDLKLRDCARTRATHFCLLKQKGPSCRAWQRATLVHLPCAERALTSSKLATHSSYVSCIMIRLSAASEFPTVSSKNRSHVSSHGLVASQRSMPERDGPGFACELYVIRLHMACQTENSL